MPTLLLIFGDTVRKLRHDKGLSQEKLAELSGLHRTYIGGIERGERNIGLLNIIQLAKALGVVPSALFQHLDVLPADDPPER
jgi:transcriptional regulator with XRE-family HTH domain